MTGAARPPEAVPGADQLGESDVVDSAASTPDAGSADAQAAELAKARAEVEERTADLKRITAEYANYRKRVDRDRVAVVEGATGAVLAGLLPVLDDIDRARAHGDLTGAFKAVADQLEGVLEKLGLQPFGAAGDPFDPMLHEAVAHSGSAEVTVPTCMVVLRRGFRLGERLLRPALVTVADPADEAPAAATEAVAPTDLPTATAPADPPAAHAAADPPAGPPDPAAKADQPPAEPGGSAEKPAGGQATAPPAAATAWTPPKSAPGGSTQPAADPQPAPEAEPGRAEPGGAEPGGADDGETPVDWFDKSAEQQD